MCAHGEQDRIAVGGKSVLVDRCIVPLVEHFDRIGMEPLMSCCGHGETDGFIWCKHWLVTLSRERNEVDVSARYRKAFEEQSYRHSLETAREGTHG
jgi:hypothetical protein